MATASAKRWFRIVLHSLPVFLLLGAVTPQARAQQAAFFDHFGAVTLDSRWNVLTAQNGTVATNDSFVELNSPSTADVAAMTYGTKIDKTRSQLWVFSVSNDSGTNPQWWITLANSASAPSAANMATWGPTLRAQVRATQSGSTPGISFIHWNATHTQSNWNGTTNAWAGANAVANQPVRADDYYLVALEIDGPGNRWRMMVWGRRSGSTGQYTFDQGMRLFSLTNWVSWSAQEATDDLWLVLGDPVTDSVQGRSRIEWARLDMGARQHIWVNDSDGGGTYNIRLWYGYENASGAVELFVPQDRTSVAVPVTAGSWDSDNVKAPFVVQDGATYYLFYNGKSSSGIQIGMATASDPDGPWTKYSGNPIVSRLAGTEENGVALPAVVKDEDEADASRRWKMIYAGSGADGKARLFYATAPAATGPWSRQGKILDVGPPGSIDELGVSRARPYWINNQWYVYHIVRDVTANGTSDVSYSTGPDFTLLTKSNTLLLAKDADVVQSLTANLNGRVVTVASTAGFVADSFVRIRKSPTDSSNFAVSRIRKILSSTQIELYHGVDGFAATGSAQLVQLNGLGIRNAASELVQVGGTWHLYITNFGQGLGEMTAMLTAPSPAGPFDWAHPASPPVTLASWGNSRSNENITFVHQPLFRNGGGPDVTPPIVSAVTASGITTDAATISWITDEDSDSQVEYGPTTAYGMSTTLDITLVTSHSMPLAGLQPGTLYHFRVLSADAAGNRAISGDFTFTTAQGPNTPPMANFTFSCVNLQCDFDATGSSDPDGSIVTYAWDFGDGSPTGSGATISHTFAAAASYIVTLTVTDNRGDTAIDSQTVIVMAPPSDGIPPSVSLTAPQDGATVDGTAITVSADATDNVGVVGVQFKLNGANLGAEDTTAPYSVNWDTTTTANGSYTLTAVARDAAGNQTTSAPASVTVDNNYALDFDGVNDSLVASSQPPPVQLSLSVWIHPRTLGGRNAGHLLSIRDPADNNPQVTLRLANNSQIRVIVVFDNNGASSGGAWDTPAGSIALNQLQHVAIAYDGSSPGNVPSVYVNGVAQPIITLQAPTGVMRTQPASWVVGNNVLGDGAFNGIMDEVRVYERVLSTAEVLTHYNSGQLLRLGPEPGLAALWHFDEGSGTVAVDSSGNGRTAILLNGLQWVLH